MIIEFKNPIRGKGIFTENIFRDENLINTNHLEDELRLKHPLDIEKIWRNTNFVIWTKFRINILSPLIDQIFERLNNDNRI